MKPIILFRQDKENFKEFATAKKHFEIVESRSKIPSDALIFPRYSALPYFKEMEEDVKNHGSRLINGIREFRYIETFEYYHDIEEHTFKTWFEQHLLDDKDAPFVVKGATNSKKGWWKDKMFAENKRVAILTALELRADALIGQQDIIFRKFEKLKTFEIGVQGLPITNEHRCFFYKNRLLSHGYYWSQADKPELGNLSKEGLALAQNVADIISLRNNFFVIDVAEKENGEWIVVECNAGEMSGTSLCDLDELYGNLAREVKND
jgi:hypothetical protein